MKRCVVACWVLALIGSAAAKTVAWYHFDEASPGTTTTEKPMVLNAVNPAKHAGTPQYYWNAEKKTNDAYMPVYSNAFPVGRTWVDPRTGKMGTLNRALHIVNPAKRGEYGNGERGVVQIPDDPAFHLQTFTVEMFVKDLYPITGDTPGNCSVTNRQSRHYVLSKKNSWGLFISGGPSNANGSHTYAGVVGRSENGVLKTWTSEVNNNVLPRIMRDGNWHHLAMVVDGSNPAAVKVDFYLDYCRLEISGTMPGPVYYDDTPICIGFEYGGNNNGWGGLIDELRISDTALSPDAFLRFCNENADADTVLYYSFDSWFGSPFTPSSTGRYCTSIVNETPFVNPPVGSLGWRPGAQPDRMDSSAGTLRRDLATPTGHADGGALRLNMNTDEQGCAIDLPLSGNQIFTGGDFTFEMFLRMETLPPGYAYLFLGDGRWPWYVTIQPDGRLTFEVNWQVGVETSPVLADFAWHHLAVVSTPGTRTSRFYVDYVLVGTIEDETYYIDAGKSETALLRLFCYNEIGWANSAVKNVEIGEMRIVKRALGPQEFLTARAVQLPAIASIGFDGDWSYGPTAYADLLGTGVRTGGADWSAARPVKGTVVSNALGAVVSPAATKSLALAGGTVAFGRNLVLDRADAYTLEFFLRPATLAGEARVLALEKTAPVAGTIWALTLAADGRTLTLAADTAAAAGQTCAFDLAAGTGWRHFGLVFAPDGGATHVTLYLDGVSCGTRTLAGRLDTTAADSRLTVGSAAFTGHIDEIRVTQGALTPDEMMRGDVLPGLTVFVR